MSFKRSSLLSRFRSKDKTESKETANLGKLEVETMPKSENEEVFEEEEEAITIDPIKEQEQDEDQPVEEKQEDLSSEYEGQLTIDVFQTPKDIVIVSTIAGVDPTDIDVSIDNDMVTVKGERKNEFESSEDDYYYQECYWGSFSRSVILPVDVIADKAEASLKNGILTVKLPKAKQSKSKKISVKAV